MSARAITALALLLVALDARPAAAHGRSTSWARVTVDGARVDVVVRLQPVDAAALRAAGLGAAALAEASSGDAPCPLDPGATVERRTADGLAETALRLTCPARPTRVGGGLSLTALAGHLRLVRLEDGPRVDEVALTATHPTLAVAADDAAAAPAASTAARFLRLGVEHILSGVDHLLFLVVLLALARTRRDVVLAVSGFTVGHSLTLASTALGLLRPVEARVEALVALSIAVVAVENLSIQMSPSPTPRDRPRTVAIAAALALLALVAAVGLLPAPLGPLALVGLAAVELGLGAMRDPARARVLTAAIFGLLHGLAFAGALLHDPAPRGQLVLALACFNAGVELGQLAVVAALVAAVLAVERAIGRARLPRRALATVGSAAALGVALRWLFR